MFFFIITPESKAAILEELEDSISLYSNENEIKVISKSKVYLIDTENLTIPTDLCHENIKVPRNSIKEVSKATKRQLSFTCKPQRRKNTDKR